MTDRDKMFWRKNGEELYEDLNKYEIIPSYDGSFQMGVDLNISSNLNIRGSMTVYFISGVKFNIVKRLNKRQGPLVVLLEIEVFV